MEFIARTPHECYFLTPAGGLVCKHISYTQVKVGLLKRRVQAELEVPDWLIKYTLLI